MSNSKKPTEDSKSIDRRAAVRYLCNLDIACQPPDNPKKERWPAAVRDISQEGMGLVLDRSFEAGSVLGVELQSPDEMYTYTVFARVVHAKPLPDGKWRIGAVFVRKLTKEELQSLL